MEEAEAPEQDGTNSIETVDLEQLDEVAGGGEFSVMLKFSWQF